jgi:hypothetical protein
MIQGPEMRMIPEIVACFTDIKLALTAEWARERKRDSSSCQSESEQGTSSKGLG